MKEKLYEMAKTAGLYTKTSVIVSAVPLDQMLEKFAELIAEDCATIADDCIEDEWFDVGGAIREHYGLPQ